MRSVYFHLTEYCKKRDLPEPTAEDLKSCGAMIKHHFLNYWGPKQSIGSIEDSGFALMTEPSGTYVVALYPTAMADDMDARVDLYYKSKAVKRIETSIAAAKTSSPPKKEEKPKRKRIPVSSKS